MYNAHKNVGVHYTWQNTLLLRNPPSSKFHSLNQEFYLLIHLWVNNLGLIHLGGFSPDPNLELSVAVAVG